MPLKYQNWWTLCHKAYFLLAMQPYPRQRLRLWWFTAFVTNLENVCTGFVLSFTFRFDLVSFAAARAGSRNSLSGAGSIAWLTFFWRSPSRMFGNVRWDQWTPRSCFLHKLSQGLVETTEQARSAGDDGNESKARAGSDGFFFSPSLLSPPLSFTTNSNIPQKVIV